MSGRSRLFFLMLASALAVCGCGSVNTPAPTPAASAYQVLTVSDLHFNPLYDPTLYSALVGADASQWAGIFQGSTVTRPSAWGADTNYPLLTVALASMKQQMGASPVVLFTGDLLGHNIPQMFYTGYYNTSQYPTADATAVAAMQQFMDKTLTFVGAEVRADVGNAPVIYVVGNIDTYSGGIGPDSTFLGNNAGTIYTQFLAGSANQQTFLSTFTSGGYYSAQPVGSNLVVLGLNTNSFVDGSPTNAEAGAELAWLNSQLASAQAAGQKVWVLMHVPPGANPQGMASVTPGQLDENNVTMIWDAGYQSMFMQTLASYPGVVTLMLAGHTHMDEYRILPTGDVLEQLPSISPCFGNNPAFKVLTVASNTLMATNYQSFDYDLSIMPAQFSSLYTLSMTYGAQGTLNNSLTQLYPQLVGNASTRNTNSYYFASGSTAVNPSSNTPWNPINSADWPFFACTISKTDEPDYINCVNTY